MTGVAPQSDIMSRVASITSTDSPLMRQARATGAATANRRGVLNSSMGIGAMQDAVLRAAVPIASQESAQDATTANLNTQLTSQEGIAARDLAGRKDMNTAQITSNEGISRANLAASEREKLISAQVQAGSTYSQALANTLNNENIPAATRTQVQQALLNQYNDVIAAAQRVYGTPTAAMTTPPTSGANSMIAPNSGIGALNPYEMRDYYAQQYAGYA